MIRLLVILIFIVTAPISWADDSVADSLRHNPFERPAVQNVNARQTNLEPSQIDDLKLRGVVLAGSKSLANVDGIIYRLGKKKNGMRLKSVDEDGAEFVRNGAYLRLSLESSDGGEQNEE